VQVYSFYSVLKNAHILISIHFLAAVAALNGADALLLHTLRLLAAVALHDTVLTASVVQTAACLSVSLEGA